MSRCFFVIILLLLFTAQKSLAQVSDIKCFYVKTNTVLHDSLTIIPGSAFLSSEGEGNSFIILPEGNSVLIKTIEDSIQICYKTLQFDLGKTYFNRSLQIYDSQAVFKDPPNFNAQENFSPIKKDDLTHQGAITRGFTVGNQQSLTMQSRMNLQLEGRLNNDLQVSAHITDQQVPYLPEGNSQYLRDYDHVSVKLYNDKFSLEAGNQQWRNKNSYFGNYNRNVEGARIQLFRDGKNGRSTTTIGGASARGKFSRQNLEVQDGVSGPYRIPRPSASQSVVILPGTENVFLDGKELIRGYDNDYTIDYNQGEISFTNNIILTRFSRLIIEFEYTQLTYQQTSITAEHVYNSEKGSGFFHYYRQHDNPRQSLGVDLKPSELSLIANEEPVNNLIFIPSADSIGYQDNQLMYAKKDTAVEGRSYNIYYYSINPELAHYRLSFRESNQGNYIIKSYSAAGRIYEWISPVNGIPQGDYEPVIAVNPPETRQILSFGGHRSIGDFTNVGAEYTTSVINNNNLNNKTSNGGALRLFYEVNDRPLNFLTGYDLSHILEVQWVNKDFNSLERFRSVEFDRLWLINDSIRSNELLLKGLVKVQKSEDKYYQYDLNRRYQENFLGWYHGFKVKERWKNFTTEADVTLVESERGNVTSDWFNYNFDVNYKAGNWQPGIKILSEKNQILLHDSLYASKNAFKERQLYVNHFNSNIRDFSLLYAVREDQLPLDGELEDFSRSHTLTAASKLKNFDARMNYRKLSYMGISDSEDMLSGDMKWRTNLFNKVVQQEIGYGISQGRELSKAFEYMQVIPGEGTHAWRDLDNDNIKDIDEFFEAINIDERNYIKILIPTNDYLPAYETRFSYRGDYGFPAKWKTSEGLENFLSRVAGSLNYQSERKTSSDDWIERLWLFNEEAENDLLISDRTVLNGKIYLKRSHEKFSGSLQYRGFSRKQWFQAGFQEGEKDEWSVNFTYSINSDLDFLFEGAILEEEANVTFSERGSYQLKGWQVNPELVFLINSQWQISGSYQLQQKEAVEFADGFAIHNQARLNTKYNRKNMFLASDIRFIHIEFEGDQNTATGYTLLDAMQPGQNIYWQLNLQQKLTKVLRLSLFYDGRKPEEMDAIHMGRIQVTALF